MTENEDKNEISERVQGDASSSADINLYDDLDEELLALSGPPPNIWYGLFTLLILAMSLFMMVWFFPTLRYLTRGINDTVELGEAASLDLSTLESDSLVSVNGIPMMTRILAFNEGVKWFFLSNTQRHIFPLAGQPNLFIQWEMPSRYKAYQTTPVKPGPPSHFEGHLVRRSELDTGYDRLFVFFDCMRLHSNRRCNTCLGIKSSKDCREAFTCAENNSAQECSNILDSEVDSESDAEMAMFRREQRAAVSVVMLEEFVVRARKIADNPRLAKEDRVQLDVLRRSLNELQVAELEIKAMELSRKVDRMNQERRSVVEGALKELEELRVKEVEHIETQKTLHEYIEVGDQLQRIRKKTRAVQKEIALLGDGQAGLLSKWTIDPISDEGKDILEAIRKLQVRLQELGVGRQSGDDLLDGGIMDGGLTTKAPSPDLAAVIDPERTRVVELLEKVRTRLRNVQRKMASIVPGQIKEFDTWVRRPDVLGVVPMGLRTDEVMVSLSKIEQFLHGVVVDESETPNLIRKMNQGVDEAERLRKRIEEIRAQDGLQALASVKPIRLLAKEVAAGKDFDDATKEVEHLAWVMMKQGIYPPGLRGWPDQLEAIEARLTQEVVEDLNARLSVIEASLNTEDWLVVDREIPFDKLWVILIYLALGAMIFVNIRKLLLFWRAWKA
jgi:hypothetical protein